MVAKGRRLGREAEVCRRELLYREWISNKVLLYSTESCLQHSVKTIMEEMIFFKRTHTHTHTHTHTDTYMTAEINTTLSSNYTSIFFLIKKIKIKINNSHLSAVRLCISQHSRVLSRLAFSTCHAASPHGMTPSLAVPMNTLILARARYLLPSHSLAAKFPTHG